MNVAICCIFIFIGSNVYRNTPLNLAGMAIERFVAVCYPLHHGQICTTRNTKILIGIIWLVGAVPGVVDLLVVLALRPLSFFTTSRTCFHQNVFDFEYNIISHAVFNIGYMCLVWVLLFYTYFKVLFSAKAAASEPAQAQKARRTILLHGVQLLLCTLSLFTSVLDGALTSLFPYYRHEGKAANNVANMAAMQFGLVDEYKEAKEDFESYIERFEQWLLANDIASEKKQLKLDQNSEKYLTINTHRGLYKYHRLSYGVASAPSIFQAVMDQILQGLDHVTCFLDDILVTASTKEEHIRKLDVVLTRLERYGLRVKLSKCQFMQSSVEYLGHRIDKEGLHPTDEKKQPWSWTAACDMAFEEAKQLLLGSTVLVHYDGNRPLKLACDASPYGVGAVILHILDNEEERPIAFASRTLTETEKKYAQIEREALSIIYGVDDLPVSAKDIAQATRKDPTLCKVWNHTVNGWPNYVSEENLKPYFTCRHELSEDQGCVLWGMRVIIPPKYRSRLLDELHHEHPRICRMKALARSILWWPGLDGCIEEKVHSCSCCLAVQKSPAGAPLYPWRWPERPWQRIHIDFAEKDKQFFLVVIDSHSKWKNTSRAVSKASNPNMFFPLKPDLARSVQEKQQEQNRQHDQRKRVLRSFVEEEPVRVRNFRGGQGKWLSATVIERKGPVSYLVQEGHRRHTVHVDHMLSRNAAVGSPTHGVLEILNSSVTDDNSGPLNFPTPGDCSTQILEPKSPENTENLTAQDPGCATPAVETVRRYPQRIRTALKRLDL
ncbi:olfactory receptor 4C3-like protein [Labeo rohita]|uniref:Gypsy retrotransposon integrase-like protein 1 n=1 Tax=Labeo rohita TaxID=84645 RepID=A0A498MNE6_LABRO|nr:olfactory receptor 4C3-like protein [Labeo rohita]